VGDSAVFGDAFPGEVDLDTGVYPLMSCVVEESFNWYRGANDDGDEGLDLSKPISSIASRS
jgi:hypothetical protein